MGFWGRLKNTWPASRAQREREIEREIQNHLDLEAEESDRARAQRAFGNVTLVKEETREAWGWSRLEQLARDSRYGLRQIRRTPGFSAVSILTLALGIGGVTAIFSAFYAVLIRPLPYADADRLVVIWDEETRAQIPKQFAAPAEWLAWRRLNTVFSDIAATQPAAAVLSGGSEPDQVPARKVTANLWSVLGVTPLVGRVFTESRANGGASFERRWPRRPIAVTPTAAGASTPNPKSR